MAIGLGDPADTIDCEFEVAGDPVHGIAKLVEDKCTDGKMSYWCEWRMGEEEEETIQERRRGTVGEGLQKVLFIEKFLIGFPLEAPSADNQNHSE